MLAILLLCISVAVALPASEYSGQKRYDNYRLLTVKAENEEQLNVLRELQINGHDSEFFDFWSDPSLIRPAEISISPTSYQRLVQFLTSKGLSVDVQIPDIQRLIDVAENAPKSLKKLNFNARAAHNVYRRYSEISDLLTDFDSTYWTMARKRTMGLRTAENRYMEYLEISTNGFAGTRPAIFVEAGIHAREWISPATILYIIDRLLSSYQSDNQATFMLDNFDWYFVPVTNPDGYEYCHTNDRYWRKNRNLTANNCIGTDLNRNFDSRWGTTGVSTNCRSDVYPGASPMSEVEARNVEALVQDIQRNGNRLIAYLAVHSYSQMILVPYSHTFGQRPPFSANMDNYGRAASDAIRNVHGRYFQVGTAPEILYEASGGSEDWAIMGGGVKYAYCYELRPASASAGGFVLPASEIIPSGEETFASFHSMAQSFHSD